MLTPKPNLGWAYCTVSLLFQKENIFIKISDEIRLWWKYFSVSNVIRVKGNLCQGHIKVTKAFIHCPHSNLPHNLQFTIYFINFPSSKIHLVQKKIHLFGRILVLVFGWYHGNHTTSIVKTLWPQGHEYQRNPEMLWLSINKNSNNLLAQFTFQRYPKINRSFLMFFFCRCWLFWLFLKKFLVTDNDYMAVFIYPYQAQYTGQKGN